MTRAAEARGEHRPQLDVADVLRRLLVDRAVRLHRAAEVNAAAVERREARRAVLGAAVVADERGAARDLALLGAFEERRDHVFPFGEVRDRAQVDLIGIHALAHERRQDSETEHRNRKSGADQRADADRRKREERRAVDIRSRVGDRRHPGLVHALGGRRDRVCREQVAYPEEAEHQGDERADDQRGNADDETDENTRDADREADRPEARCGDVRGVVLLFAHTLDPCSAS